MDKDRRRRNCDNPDRPLTRKLLYSDPVVILAFNRAGLSGEPNSPGTIQI